MISGCDFFLGFIFVTYHRHRWQVWPSRSDFLKVKSMLANHFKVNLRNLTGFHKMKNSKQKQIKSLQAKCYKYTVLSNFRWNDILILYVVHTFMKNGNYKMNFITNQQYCSMMNMYLNNGLISLTKFSSKVDLFQFACKLFE